MFGRDNYPYIIIEFVFSPYRTFCSTFPNICAVQRPVNSLSQKYFLHIVQMVKTGRFQKFDHGSSKKNMEAYGEPIPPEIDISQIKVPIAMFMPQNDILGNIKDSKDIISRL